MSKRILIVEDEKNLARFVSLELQHEGYDVVTADNGREGRERFRSYSLGPYVA